MIMNKAISVLIIMYKISCILKKIIGKIDEYSEFYIILYFNIL